MFFLTKAPIWIAAVLVVLITVASMFGPVLVRRRLGLEWLRTNNEVAGFKFATVGVIYAVLLGFAVITVWDKFTAAETTVSLEAGAAATVFRLANGIDAEASSALRAGITGYLRAAITQEWPAMQIGPRRHRVHCAPASQPTRARRSRKTGRRCNSAEAVPRRRAHSAPLTRRCFDISPPTSRAPP